MKLFASLRNVHPLVKLTCIFDQSDQRMERSERCTRVALHALDLVVGKAQFLNELVDKTRLSDTWLARDQHEAASLADRLPAELQERQLVSTTDQRGRPGASRVVSGVLIWMGSSDRPRVLSVREAFEIAFPVERDLEASRQMTAGVAVNEYRAGLRNRLESSREVHHGAGHGNG